MDVYFSSSLRLSCIKTMKTKPKMVKARKSWIKMLFLSERKVNSFTNQSINNYNSVRVC